MQFIFEIQYVNIIKRDTDSVLYSEFWAQNPKFNHLPATDLETFYFALKKKEKRNTWMYSIGLFVGLKWEYGWYYLAQHLAQI